MSAARKNREASDHQGMCHTEVSLKVLRLRYLNCVYYYFGGLQLVIDMTAWLVYWERCASGIFIAILPGLNSQEYLGLGSGHRNLFTV